MQPGPRTVARSPLSVTRIPKTQEVSSRFRLSAVSEHLLYTGPINNIAYCDILDWAPDGKVLSFSEPVGSGQSSRLSSLSLSDRTVRPLTSPQNHEFDCVPAYSPDGSNLAFIRGFLGGAVGDLFVLPVSGGEPRRLTSGNFSGSPAWTEDGKELIFSSGMGGAQTLWRIPASGGVARLIPGVGDIAIAPSISRKGNQLAYQQDIHSDKLWRLTLKDPRHSLGPPARLFSNRGFIRRPDFSPDGKKIVFESNRLGYSDIWSCDVDGSNCAQLTSIHGVSGNARWSPDGHYISYESVSQKFYEIFVIEVPGGQARLVATFPGSNNGAPNWSRDGQWLYFYSAHESGPLQLWKIPFKGGSPVQVTKKGGVYAAESYDGRSIYFTKMDQSGVWKMPIEGGDETRILDQPSLWSEWRMVQSGIYFFNPTISPNGRIDFFDFASRETTPILTLDSPFPMFGGLAVSPDGKSLLYGQSELDFSYIMLVRNFR